MRPIRILRRTRMFAAVMAILLPCTLPLSAQVRQTGQVTLQNSGKQPLAGVQVRAMGAVPASSDVEGNFNLHFNKARPGQLLLLDEVYKEGYELVNEQALKQWTVSAARPLPIVMCPKGQLAAAQEKYYEIGKQHNMERYAQACRQLEEQLKQNRISTEAYNAELDKLSATYLRTMEQLEAYAYAMACYNRDDLNQTSVNALALVEAGQVDEALELYEQAQLGKLYTGLDKRLEQEAREMEAMLPSLRLNADICLFAGGEENIRKAQNIYEAIALSDTTNAAYATDYAAFLSDNLYMLQEAQQWQRLALRHSTDSLQLAELYSGIAMLDTYLQEPKECADYLEKADKIYSALARQEDYAQDAYFNMSYASHIINQSRYWRMTNQQDKAVQVLTDNLSYAAKALDLQPEKYCYHYAFYVSEMAGSIHDFYMAFHATTRDNLQTIINLGEATIEILKYANRKERAKAIQMTAETYQLMARACTNFKQMPQSEAYTDSCLQVIEQGNKVNPALFSILKAQVLETQGQNLMNRQKHKEAIQKFLQAFEIIRQTPYDLKGYMQILYHISTLSPVLPAEDALAYTALAWEELKKHPNVLSGIMVFDICYKYALIHSTQGKDLPTCEEALLQMIACAKTNDGRREWITDKNLSDIVLPCTALYYMAKHKSQRKATVLDSMTDLLKCYPKLKESNVYQQVLTNMK